MSYERGLQAVNLQPTDKIPHTEYLSNRKFIQKVTGLDIDNPAESGRASVEIAKALDFDFVWSCYGRDWGLPHADMGRAKFAESEVPWESSYPFKTEDEVLSFDPLKAANLPSLDELAADVRRSWESGRDAYPGAIFPGGFYNSVFTWAIVTFGWDLFLLSAKIDMERFDKVLEGFFEISMMVVQAHVKAEVPYFLCHDDIVWASGAVFHPDWMRKYVFPRHKRMWAPLLEAGIKVLFCSDGNFTEFIDDIADAGAEGFIMEPMTDMAYICEKYGQSHVIIGNADSRILQFGTMEQIRAEVKRCADLGKPCPGYFYACGNHIPYTVPVEAVECYFAACEEFGKR